VATSLLCEACAMDCGTERSTKTRTDTRYGASDDWKVAIVQPPLVALSKFAHVNDYIPTGCSCVCINPMNEDGGHSCSVCLGPEQTETVHRINEASRKKPRRSCLVNTAESPMCSAPMLWLINQNSDFLVGFLGKYLKDHPEYMKRLLGKALIDLCKKGPMQFGGDSSSKKKEKLQNAEKVWSRLSAEENEDEDDPDYDFDVAEDVKQGYYEFLTSGRDTNINAKGELLRSAFLLRVVRAGVPIEEDFDQDCETSKINGERRRHVDAVDVFKEVRIHLDKKHEVEGYRAEAKNYKEEDMDRDGDGTIDEDEAAYAAWASLGQQRLPWKFWKRKDYLATFDVGLDLQMIWGDEEFEFQVCGNRCYLPYEIASIRIKAMHIKGNAIVWWDIAEQKIAFGFRDDPPPTVIFRYDLEMRWLPCAPFLENRILAALAKTLLDAIDLVDPVFLDLKAEPEDAAVSAKINELRHIENVLKAKLRKAERSPMEDQRLVEELRRTKHLLQLYKAETRSKRTGLLGRVVDHAHKGLAVPAKVADRGIQRGCQCLRKANMAVKSLGAGSGDNLIVINANETRLINSGDPEWSTYEHLCRDNTYPNAKEDPALDPGWNDCKEVRQCC